MRKPHIWLLGVILVASGSRLAGQSSPIFTTDRFHTIRGEASGERPLSDFQQIVTRFSGFSPSKGGDELAEFIAGRLRANGLQAVTVEGYPSDGKTFFWTFLGEPAWEAESATLNMVEPRSERLADFAAHRVVLGRFSTSADVTAALVDVASGMRQEDYAGKDVKGKIVLADGDAQVVHKEAVWGRGAAGVVSFRTNAPDEPQMLSNPSLGNKTGVPGEVAWRGPKGEAPGFLFSVSVAQGNDIRALLRRGPVVVRAQVIATTGPGEYKQVEGIIPGTDPSAKEVWVKSHTNYRNTGGGNNLTGVGATLEISRTLNSLIVRGLLPRPRRTIRFQYSAEHFGSTYQFYVHPERLSRPLTFFSVDMTGFNQKKVDGVTRVYRTPHSKPHFLSEVAEELADSVARANTNTARHGGFLDPTFAPTGSRDAMGHSVEEFWAPSDHEEMVEGSIGVPSVEFGHPDRFIGSQEDGVDKVDPTQMRRSVLLIASAAYYLASLTADDVPRLLPVMITHAQARLGRELGRAVSALETAPAGTLQLQFREGVNILSQAISRERATLDSLSDIGLTPAVEQAVALVRQQLQEVHGADEKMFRARVASLASAGGLTLQEPAPSAAEQQLAALVPRRNPSIKGPVNLWRPEYGSVWVAERTGNSDVLGNVPLTKKGRFVAYEALNFVNGRRTLLEIRDAVSAEYTPLDASDVEQYFRLLAKLGVLTLEPAPASAK